MDVLGSISRVMPDVVAPEHMKAARRAVASMAAYRGAEDLINIGAYVDGSNPEIDAAKAIKPGLDAFLRQDLFERASFEEARSGLMSLFPVPGGGGGKAEGV